MADVIYEAIGPNYQYPGLPYDKDISNVRIFIFDDVPSEDQINRTLSFANDTTIVNPWTSSVIKGFRWYIPTTYKRATKNMPHGLCRKLFGTECDWVPESEQILLQLQSEIEAKPATLDAAVISSRRDLETVVNKAHIVNRLYFIGRLYNHLNIRPDAEANNRNGRAYFLWDMDSEEKLDLALMDMKRIFMEFMMEVPVGKRNYQLLRKTQDLSDQEIRQFYPYIKWFEENLGNNLMGILLYGSAARTVDPAEYSDFDNWIVVKNVRKAEETLRGRKPSFYNGKVVEGLKEGDAPEEKELERMLLIPKEELTRDDKAKITELRRKSPKHIGVQFFPYDKEYFARFIRFLHDSVEFRLHTRILMGEFYFPYVAQDEVVQRGLAHAHIKLKTITGSLNWAYHRPDKIVGKPNLFDFVVKNIRFFYQSALNATEGPDFRDKAELNRRLAAKGIYIPPYTTDLRHIRNSLVYATRAVFSLQQEFIRDYTPDLSFLVSEPKEKPDSLPNGTWEKADED